MSRIIKCCGILLTAAVVSEAVYQLYKRWITCKNEDQQNESRKDEVVFFPDQEMACKNYFTGEDGCENDRCRFTHKPNSLSKLYEYLAGAQVSLDVCVFIICCADLGDLLISAHRRGVKVRVICDDEQVDVSGSQVWKLRKNGR